MSRFELWCNRMRLKSSPVILDIGGKPSPSIEANAGRVVPVNTSGFTSFRHRVQNAHWVVSDVVGGPGVDIVCDIHDLSQFENTFDGICCSFVLEHVRQPWTAISEMVRSLKPEGLLWIGTHHTFPLHYYPQDYFRFSDAALTSMAIDAGGTIAWTGYSDPCSLTAEKATPLLPKSQAAWMCVEIMISQGPYKMRIGLDLDGTVYANPAFFAAMIDSMSAAGHSFFCTSSHGRDEWETDCHRLNSLGVNPELISPELLNAQRHGDLAIKARQADQLDVVFDDDGRLARLTHTPVMCPAQTGGMFSFQKFTA